MNFGSNTTMPMKTTSYKEWLDAKLSDPRRAARYLNAAAEDSEAMFLKALRKVASSQSRSMADIAAACGVSRESLYRMLSEAGNPTSENRRSILAVLGLKSIVVPIEGRNAIGPGPHGYVFTQGTPTGNSFCSGGSEQAIMSRPAVSGTIALSVPVRKGPMLASNNSSHELSIRSQFQGGGEAFERRH